MKKFLMTTALVTVTALSAGAQTATTEEPGMFRTATDPMEIRASDFIGMNIYGTAEGATGDQVYTADQRGAWDSIGSVGDLILDREGNVEAVLVDIGGFLGIGAREVAIDINEVVFVPDSEGAVSVNDYYLVIATTRDALENAPGYEGPTEGATQTVSTGTTGTTGTDATVETVEDPMMDTAETDPAADPAMDPATDTAQTDGTTDPTAQPELDATDMAETDTAAEPATDPATDTAQLEPVPMEGDYEPLGADMRTVDALLGADIYDLEDNNIGTVSDLVLGSDDAITHVVFDVGGFLGIGSRTVALSVDEVEVFWNATDDDVRVNVPMTRDQLEALPEYDI